MLLSLESLWLLFLAIGFSLQTAVIPQFINPPPFDKVVFYTYDQTWSVGSQLQLQWITSLSEYSIWLWQQSLTEGAAMAGDPIFTKQSTDTELGATNWVVDIQAFDLRQSNVFYFALGPNITLTGAMLSHYVNLTTSQVVAGTMTTSSFSASSLSTSTSTAQATTSTSATVVSTSAAIPTSTVQTAKDASSQVTKIGLGAGLGIGIPIVLLLAAIVGFMALRRRREARAQPIYLGSEKQITPTDTRGYQSPLSPYQSAPVQKYELPGQEQKPHFIELPGR